jgi:hypothetical protein
LREVSSINLVYLELERYWSSILVTWESITLPGALPQRRSARLSNSKNIVNPQSEK